MHLINIRDENNKNNIKMIRMTISMMMMMMMSRNIISDSDNNGRNKYRMKTKMILNNWIKFESDARRRYMYIKSK